jgi:hypothetical protein
VPITFTERENYESGFKRVFDKQIASGLATLEAERERLKRQRTIKLIAAAIILVVVIGGAVWSENQWIIAIAIVAGIVAAIWIVGSPTEKFRAQVRDLVMPAVTKFLGIDYSRTVPPSFDINTFRGRNLIGAYDRSRSRLQDHVAGTHGERRYTMVDAHLQRKSGKSTVTVFKGLLLSIDWPEARQADVLIGRDWGKLLNKLAGITKAERVTFDNAAFENVYEVYASDPAVARQLLTPTFLDSMVALREGRKGEPPTAAFTAGQLLVALPVREELFEPGSLSRSMAMFEEDMHNLLRQLTTPCRVIDVLHGERKQIL